MVNAPGSPSKRRLSFDEVASPAKMSALHSSQTMRVLLSEQYQISQKRGFLPDHEPLQRLPEELGGGWNAVEECFDVGQAHIHSLAAGGVGRGTEGWRKAVRKLKPADVSVLTTLPLLRRAHVLLSFLSHMYLHSTFPSSQIVPHSVAGPWTYVSNQLGVPTVLTYADTVLWNWHLIDRSKPFQADNIAMSTTFTSTESEYGFYLLSLLCELRGPPILRSVGTSLDLITTASSTTLPSIAAHLHHITSQIEELAEVLRSATEGPFGPGEEAVIVPECFYREVRPWFNGGKWIYEGNESKGFGDQEFDFGGPSAGQSSLIHVIDLFLGVDHSPRTPLYSALSSKRSTCQERALFAPVATSAVVPSRDATFMARMAAYMPSPHRALLSHLSAIQGSASEFAGAFTSVRHLMDSSLGQSSPELLASYNSAVHAMKRFRDLHMRLVSVFIIAPSTKAPSKDSVFWAEWEEQRLARERKAQQGILTENDLKGTGGTSLVSFLRTCRKRTIEALYAKQEAQM